MSFPLPPLFLPVAGVPSIEWKVWKAMFNNYLLAIDSSQFSEARKRAILQNCLGAEGQKVFLTLTSGDNLDIQ